LAERLVWVANWIVRNNDTPQPRPYYRPVDTHMPGIGHEWSCGAYSYEGLKSLVEQDGPDGFGATATVKWFIGKEGWQSLEGMPLADIKAMFAQDGHFDMSPPLPPLEDDRVAMMLGLVPDQRTPVERLLDAIRTNGKSLRYHYHKPT
jgi:hypothetical protein